MGNSNKTIANAVEITPAHTDNQNTAPVVAIPQEDLVSAPLETQETAVSEKDNAVLLKAVEMSSNLSKMEQAVTLSAEYIQLESPGESFRGIFIGFQKLTVSDPGKPKEYKILDAARFVIAKKVWINAGAVLLNEIRRAQVPEGTPLEVTLTKIENRVKIYEIALLA